MPNTKNFTGSKAFQAATVRIPSFPLREEQTDHAFFLVFGIRAIDRTSPVLSLCYPSRPSLPFFLWLLAAPPPVRPTFVGQSAYGGLRRTGGGAAALQLGRVIFIGFV